MFEIGSSLRAARLRHGCEFPEAEAATKIRGKYLRALEEERFELLPSQTYVKGFLRAYAEFLGLDGQLYVDEFNSRYGMEDEELPSRGRRQRPQSRAHRRVETRFVLLALGGIASAAALVLVAWQFGAPESLDVPNLGAEGQTTATGAATTAAAPAGGVELILAAVRGNSRVTVLNWSARGEVLFDGTIERGHSRRFTAKKRLWLNVASPRNLVAQVNGEARELPGRARPVVVLATPEGIKLLSS